MALLTCVAARPLRSLLAATGVLRALSLATGLSWLAVVLSNRSIRGLDKDINQFLFEDYVHADKD